MPPIHVPRPPQHAMNPDRPVSSLLLAQIQHLHEAEKSLPLRYRSERYIHAIKTEGEAAAYIRELTEATHKAHADAEEQRARSAARRKRGLDIAAAAESSSATAKSKIAAKSKIMGKNSKRSRKT
jgi:hypothetical protein